MGNELLHSVLWYCQLLPNSVASSKMLIKTNKSF